MPLEGQHQNLLPVSPCDTQNTEAFEAKGPGAYLGDIENGRRRGKETISSDRSVVYLRRKVLCAERENV